MRENKIEYYPNGNIKRLINFYGNIKNTFSYDEYTRYHNENNPDWVCWSNKYKIKIKTYFIHGIKHSKSQWKNYIKKI